MENINIFLNEAQFTHVCKNGYIEWGTGYAKETLYVSKINMIKMLNENSIDLEGSSFILNVKSNLEKEDRLEIIKRSPIYSIIYSEI